METMTGIKLIDSTTNMIIFVVTMTVISIASCFTYGVAFQWSHVSRFVYGFIGDDKVAGFIMAMFVLTAMTIFVVIQTILMPFSQAEW